MQRQQASFGPSIKEVFAARRSAGAPRPRRRAAALPAWCALVTLAALSVLPARAEAARGEPEGAERGIAAGEVILTEGIVAFEEGRDLEAEKLLADAVAADPDNGTARHWLGLAELRLGRAAAAVDSLSAALAARRPPEEGKWRAAADLGAAQLAAGDPRGAARTLAAAAEHLPDDALTWWRYGAALVRSGQQAAGERALSKARELGGKPGLPDGVRGEPPVTAPPYPGGPLAASVTPPRWEGRLSLEAGSDSNPGLLPGDSALPLIGGRLARSAGDAGADLDLRFEHHPLAGSEGWQLGWGVAGNRSAYRHQGDLDLGLGGPFVELAWGKDPRGYLTGPLGAMRVPVGDERLGLLVQVTETWTRLGSADFLRLAAASAALTLRGRLPIDGGGTQRLLRTATRIDLAASQTSFSGDGGGDLRRSGAELSLGIGESLFVGSRGGYLRLAAAGGRRRAGASFGHRFAEITAEAGTPLPAGWTLYLQASRRQARFDHPQSNLLQPGGPARSDATWRASAAAVRWLGLHLACTARVGYIRRDSNVALAGLATPFDYRRTTAGLGLSWFF